uniref:Small ribosomal subunit protein uS9c n=1 Tax=Chloromonas radiata TaxID=47907 RepID=A0A0S2ICJ6_9CHLO|nr:ribosomal protein S9 [Chloromonas radiata]
MEILARAVGRRKEAVAQVQLVRGNGQFIINDKPAQSYLQNNSCSLICIKSPLEAALNYFSNQPDLEKTNDYTSIKQNSLNAKNEKEEQIAPSLQTEKSETVNLTNISENLGAEKTFFNPSKALEAKKKHEIDVIIKVKGGGLIGQAEAIKLGVARAFCIIENSEEASLPSKHEVLRKILKTKGYLTQDSRVKERRKYGLKKARKASQYHKR